MDQLGSCDKKFQQAGASRTKQNDCVPGGCNMCVQQHNSK